MYWKIKKWRSTSQYVSAVKTDTSGNKHLREGVLSSAKANLGLGSRSTLPSDPPEVEACPLLHWTRGSLDPSYQSTWGSGKKAGFGTLLGFTE